MDAVTLLQQAEAAGLRLRVEGDKLQVRGPRSAEPLVQLLAANKPAILALLTGVEGERGRVIADNDAVSRPCLQSAAKPSLSAPDPDVAWRVEAMRTQVPRTGPIPFLVASPLVTAQSGGCLSCGDALRGKQRHRCAACQQAAWLLVNEVREDLGRAGQG